MDIASDNTSVTRDDVDGDGYDAFLKALAERLSSAEGPLFTTDATGLYDAFVQALPEERRQVYSCQHCRRFVTLYGGLVAVADDGTVRPWMWPSAGYAERFRAPSLELHRRVAGARTTGVFVSARTVWGVPENRSPRTGLIWRHMAFTPKPALVFKESPLTLESQARAEKLQEFSMLRPAIRCERNPQAAARDTQIRHRPLAVWGVRGAGKQARCCVWRAEWP